MRNIFEILFIMYLLYTILFHVDFFFILFVFTLNFFFTFTRSFSSRFIHLYTICLFIYTVFLSPFLLLLHDIFTDFYPLTTFLSSNRGSQQIFKEQFYYQCDIDKGKLCFRIGFKNVTIFRLFICLIKFLSKFFRILFEKIYIVFFFFFYVCIVVNVIK